MSTASKPSPPKPWERAGAGAASVGSSVPSTTGNTGTSGTAGASANDSPALPPRPTTMSSSSTSTVAPAASTSAAALSQQSAYGSSLASRYGSAYGGTYGGYGGGYSSYGSPYSRLGGYGGYGSYGGYGGYASPFGFPGQAGDPNGYSLTRQMEAGTAATFQLIQSIVSAFGGFAQMLESTFMATHSSFFAMIGVAEQLGNLRTWLGEALSIFTLIRWIKRLLGREKAGDAAAAGGISADGFRAFEASGTATPTSSAAGKSTSPRPSKKPLVIFLLTVVGLPWLMNKLVKLITARQEAEARRLGLPPGAVIPIFGPDGQPLPQHMQPPGVDLSLLSQNQMQQQAQQQQQEDLAALDPSKLLFVRATHPYRPPTGDDFELSFDKNDIIAVLTPKEDRTEPGWWRGRLRDGRIGWFPSTHVQEVPMSASKKAVSDTK